jgi:exonuclease SbcC
MIKAITLEGWKTHLKSEFVFSGGTNVIVGVMGSGKTSVMDAVCFCLYGTFPALNSRKATLEQTIMAKPVKKDTAKLRLEFDYNNREYAVERVVKRKGATEAVLYEDGKLINGPKPVEVSNRIEEITGISYELFSLAVYSEQNDIDHFLKLNPSQRKQKFDELLQLDKYERARANAVSVSNTVKRIVNEREKLTKEMEKEFSESALSEAETRVEEIKKGISGKMKEAEAAEAFASGNRGKLEKAEALLRKSHELAKQISISSERERMLKEREKEYEQEIALLKEKPAAAKAKELLAGAEAEYNEAEKEGRALNRRIAQIAENEGGYNAVIAQTEKSSAELAKAGAKCPVCRSPLDEHRKGEVEAENSKTAEAAALGRKKLASERESAVKELELLRKKAASLSGRMAELRKSLDEAERAQLTQKKLLRLREELGKTKKVREATEKELSSLEVDEAEIKSLRERQAAAEGKADSTKREIESAKMLAAEIKRSMEAMEKKKTAIKEQRAFVGKASGGLEKMGIFANALVATQAELREHLIEAINEAMNDVWERVYPYRDYTSAKIKADGSDYSILVRTRTGEWVKAEGVLSGGERSSVALTLRVSIALVLTRNLGWLILDEPTHNLDTNAVSALSVMLRQHLPELVEQIFIITHDKEMEKAASANLYVLSRDKAKDEPTRMDKGM